MRAQALREEIAAYGLSGGAALASGNDHLAGVLAIAKKKKRQSA
jgi:hypothetical protein